MIALVIGATGATGRELTVQLLDDPTFSEVHIFTRRTLDLIHQKLHQHLVDFDAPQSWANLVQGDVAFSCIGTTLKVAGSKENQYKIDVTYPYHFAKTAKENQVSHFILVSALGAHPKAFFFYSRIKGELEEKIKKLGFKNLSIFKPGILNRKNSSRKSEVWVVNLLQFLNKLGILTAQKPLPTSLLAKAMLQEAKSPKDTFVEIKGANILTP